LWGISTEHFDACAASLAGLRRCHFKAKPLSEVLVAGSSYSRRTLKQRLYAEKLKTPECEICGQDQVWRGEMMALILDHINGIPDDHRLENLRIVCPNCAATLSTHCGRKNRQPMRQCALCGAEFRAKYSKQKYCSRDCGQRSGRFGDASLRGIPRPASRRVARPPYLQLLAEIEATSYLAVGRKYGVSDNAIRKWVRFYEREIERRRSEAA
jgi:hypothetical protein